MAAKGYKFEYMLLNRLTREQIGEYAARMGVK